MEVVPVGRTNRDIKAREKIIKEFYVKWISEHPDKRIWNMSLGSFINVKFLSINETYEKAARDYDSTHAVLRLTEILGGAVKISEQPSKRDVRNQKQFEKMIIMRYDKVKLVVGLQTKPPQKSDGLFWFEARNDPEAIKVVILSANSS